MPPDSPWHNYLRGPEIIEDICQNFTAARDDVDLLDRFQRASTPCLVSFRAPGSPAAFESALEYLVCAPHGVELTHDVGHCFDGTGTAIPSDWVVDVEIAST